MIEIDGQTGEGGGQILRTALTLSMISGKPFRINRIRAKRPRPGLMRQHLVAVQAAACICHGQTNDARLGATALEFIPGKIQGGDYQFAIGTAGSCTLVLQTLVPALLFADTASTIHMSGGTHNPLAPPAEFLQHAYGGVLKKMGGMVDFTLHRSGFYPASGGQISAAIAPCKGLQTLDLQDPGVRVSAYAHAVIAGLPNGVALRELDVVGASMGWSAEQLHVRELPHDQGPGNIVLITVEQKNVTEVFCGFGQKMVTAEQVARQPVSQLRRYLVSGAAVGEYLADQIMLLCALAGGGSFTLTRISEHARTNAQVIEQFLPVTITMAPRDNLFECRVQPK